MIKVNSDIRKETDIKYLENYLALLAAILSKDNDNTQRYFNLYDINESRSRVKEIEKIRKSGQKTELQIWYKETMKRERKAVNKRKKKFKLLGKTYDDAEAYFAGKELNDLFF